MRSQPSFIGQPVRVSRAYETLASMIRDRILSGELAEGDRIPSETALAREAQVSRSTVREALRTLEEAGLVARASPKIMVVQRAGEDRAGAELQQALRRQNVTFRDLHEALLVLEPELTRLAAMRADAAATARLQGNLERQSAHLDDFGTWCELDREFHVEIAEMSSNPVLVMACRPISDVLQPVLESFMTSPELTHRALDLHHRILEEILVRDADAAALMARKHVNDLRSIWEQAGLNFDLRISDEAAPGPLASAAPRR
ncbi:MAG TPA: FCD domain-containing protein [Solirubrobacteraceae bacterium]|nr:FCD domain-containing protein [Solirubrobacteraceae bacterium]